MTRLYRTLTSLEECEQHLLETASGGGGVESYLAQVIAVILCSEMETRLLECAQMRSAGTSDRLLGNYVSSMLKQKRGWYGLKKTDLASFLSNYGKDVKEQFNAAVSDEKVTRYNNVVVARHELAHKSGATITVSDVRQGLDAAEEILDVVDALLNPS